MAPNRGRGATRERVLRWFALAWAGAAYVALLWLPTYGEIRETISPTGVHTVSRGSATLLAVNGPRVYGILAVPVLAALLSILPWPGRIRRASVITAAVLASAFVALGMASVGLFFLPSAVALVVAARAAEQAARPAI